MNGSQDDFTVALLDPAQPVPAGLTDAAGRPAGRRFDVYRNNVAASLTEAMHQAFPVVAKLLGQQNMDGVAGIFLRQHPPKSPLMMHYGAAFPEFLSGLEQLSHLGYLPDVARMELALRRSYHAADAQAIDPQALCIEPEALMGSTLALAPSAELVRSPWPIFAIWMFNMQQDAPKPAPGAQDVLITRPEFDPAPNLLPLGGAELIAALSKGETLGAAYEKALATDPDFDLGPVLTLLLQGNAITSLTTEHKG